jgi:heat shock protein HslJ
VVFKNKPMNKLCITFLASLLMLTTSPSFISCGGSEESSSPTTNAIPLIVPDNTTPAPAATDTTTTIYNTWVIDSINGKIPDSGYFVHGSPYIDFSTEKKISGFIGCNGINGKFNVNGQRLTFDSLSVSSQECRGKGKEFERKLLAGFKSGKTTYKIQNGNLFLNAGTGAHFIFRKIRR